MVRDGAEFIIGPRFARTRWRLLTMRGAWGAATWPRLEGWSHGVAQLLRAERRNQRQHWQAMPVSL